VLETQATGFPVPGFFPMHLLTMYHVRLHRYAVLLAGCTLLLVVAGGLVTSNDAGLSVPDWPLSYGQLMPPMVGGVLYEHGHRMVATAVGLLTIGLVLYLAFEERRRWLRFLGVAALLAVILQGVLGGLTVLYKLPKAVSVGHACLAELFFAATVAIALFTSRGWMAIPRPVEDTGSPPLFGLAVAAALALLGQTTLGAAARHQAMGLAPHIAGGAVATGMVLWVTLRVLIGYSRHRELRRSALALLVLTFCQVFLGIAAYMSRVITAQAPQPMAVMVSFTVAHVAVGALTLASSVVLALELHRNIQREPVSLAKAA
jgi:cytochrome c oxidase assembly protein subunit 15